MGVLSEYRVLDLTDEKGIFSTKILSDMGADVIRIEKPEADMLRCITNFCYLNANKRSIILNLEKKLGQELFLKLVKKTDILIVSATSNYLKSLGLDYTGLNRINPGLIMVSITHFGQSGPYRDFISCELVTQAIGGWLSVTGEPRIPLKLFDNQAYFIASLFAVEAVLMALWQRSVTKKGQFIDISIMECIAATIDHALIRYFYENIISRRRSGRHWNKAFRIFTCKDGYILLSLFQQWETLVEILASEDMADDLTDKKWLDRKARNEGLDHIVKIIESWALSHSIDELVNKGQLMRFPWAKVTSIPALLNSPQLTTRNYFSEIEHQERKYKSVGTPIKMSRSPWRAGGHVSGARENNLEVYKGEIGLSESEIASLAKQGVI